MGRRSSGAVELLVAVLRGMSVSNPNPNPNPNPNVLRGMSLATFPRALPTAFGTFSRYVLPVYADYSILPHTEFEAEAKVVARGITSSDR